jgi:amidophosphoribosyltransferase
MCGIFGVVLSDETKNAYQYILNGITVLQHRGQDSAGIYTCKGKRVNGYKNIGKVAEVFKKDKSELLLGNYGVGHIRYCTTGNLSIEQAQPLYTNLPYGISIVHNGNLTNTDFLLKILKKNNIHINSESDSDILLNYFSLLLTISLSKTIELKFAICYAIKEIMITCKGSYSVIIMINGFGLVAFRDPHGIRPLCIGKSNIGHVISSESVAISSIQFDFIRDIKPRECILVTQYEVYSKYFDTLLEGRITGTRIYDDIKKYTFKPCLFEYIYFARPESTIDGILVYQARKNMGEALANKIIKDYSNILPDIDVVMPVPDSARISALRASYILQKPYCEGLIKNNYIGRTFIMPNQEQRNKDLKIKLNTIDQEFNGKNVLVIDDSIVRGNTSIQIIKLIRKAGAKMIFFASIAPPVIYPNLYGIAIPTAEELVAYNRTNDEVCNILGADYLIYNDLNDVIDSCRKINENISSFETSCFDGASFQ